MKRDDNSVGRPRLSNEPNDKKSVTMPVTMMEKTVERALRIDGDFSKYIRRLVRQDFGNSPEAKQQGNLLIRDFYDLLNDWTIENCERELKINHSKELLQAISLRLYELKAEEIRKAMKVGA